MSPNNDFDMLSTRAYLKVIYKGSDLKLNTQKYERKE